MTIRTRMGSAIVFTGNVYLGLHDAKPEMLLEAHLASGDAGKCWFSLSELEADGGYDELHKAFTEATKATSKDFNMSDGYSTPEDLKQQQFIKNK